MPDYLFAYGTLLPGAAPAEITRAAARLKPVGEGSVRGRLYNLGHFPGAVLDPAGEQVIHGVVFKLPGDAATLAALDLYEEFDPENAAASQFLRTRCVASLASGAALECWIYVYNRGIKNVPLVEGGRWNAGTVSV